MRRICLLFLQVACIGFIRHNRANASRHCPVFSSCIDSYADIYKSLASEENSFDTESALYPAMMPSSLVVKVEFITHKETSVANYTWSLKCLYVAIPPQVLQLLSLGSVLVTPRTQELKICIPHFCRNFSSTKAQKDLMKGVLAALQDLAVSPGIRDSRLNTAECVIEGHKINMMATKRRVSITLILVFAFLFSFLIGPGIVYFVLTLLHDRGFKSSSSRRPNASTENGGGQPRGGEEGGLQEILLRPEHRAEEEISSGQESPQDPALVSSIVCVSFLLFCAEIIMLGLVFKFSISENAPVEVSIFLGILILESILLTCFSKCFTLRIDTCKDHVEVFIVIFSSILLSYHLSWLIVGIMINPLWGITVLLLACLFVVMGTFLLYQIFDRDNAQGKKGSFLLIVMCVALFFGGCSFFVLVILAGQSFFGRETADDLVKTILLYVIGGFISLFPLRGDKKNKTKPEKEKNKRTKRKQPNISNRKHARRYDNCD